MRRRTFIGAVAVIALGLIIMRTYYSTPRGPSGGLEIVASGLEIPWSIAISPDGTLYFTERPGMVNVIRDGEVHTLLTLDVAARPGHEGGLLGIELDPQFPENRRVYIYYTYRDQEGQRWNRLSRYTETGGTLSSETILLDQIPAGDFHNGGRIKFGPDGKLYATTGETFSGSLAQDLDNLGGKILRMNPDGTVPEDNPFPGSLIYSYGNRNPQGLAWHPETGALYSTEHGPSGENLRFAHDEINLIEPGYNYGWPHVVGDGDDSRYVNPLYHTGTTTWAPSGATFHDGSRHPQWRNKLFIATLRGKHLRVVTLTPDGASVESTTALYEGTLGRIRDVVQGPDGYIYLCTSNRDGRGDPGEEDDLIVRIVRPP
jgi:glucose/arabinose dehydrogenase